MTEEELLEEFFVKFDSYIEEYHKHGEPEKDFWNDLVNDGFIWSKFLDFVFNDDALEKLFSPLTIEERKFYFRFAVQCMLHFVQVNFTGPELPANIAEYLDTVDQCKFKKELAVNNEDININTKYPCLLYMAKKIFAHCHVHNLVNAWWQIRAITIHQQILDDLSQVLLSKADSLCREIANVQLYRRWQAALLVEQAQLYVMFHNISKAEKHIESACDLLGIKYELHGKLGKRTKHQQNDVAQLTLRVSLVKSDDIARPLVPELEVPENVKLNDDLRLDVIRFKDDRQSPVKIPDLEQRLFLTIIQHMLVSRPRDSLYYEEVKPFLDLILLQNNTWSVRFIVLYLRCKLEARHKRTIERSLLQCEELVKYIRKDSPHVLYRVGRVYSTNFLPTWNIEAQMAEIMLDLGLIKASLDVYLRLQLWEEVIVCYTALQMRHKAAEVIKQQLEQNPTVKLWCLLGDSTDDVTCYEKAWELSKKRSSRAQRHWGHFLFRKKQYQQCLSHFEKSVSINPLQPHVWLRYAFAALETENWQMAATAYRRYTTLEPGNFEAWNNLAKAYIKLGNKRGAHQALLDALKCNYDNWKVWDNLMVVSADICNFSDVIRAYHRILDLKEKHLDVMVLNALVYSVCGNIKDSDGNPSKRLLQKTRELMGRVTSLYPTDGHAWELYSKLAPNTALRAQRLQRSVRGFMTDGWEKNRDSCQQVLFVCQKLADAGLCNEVQPSDSLLNSIRLSINTALVAVKKQQYGDMKSPLEETYKLLEALVEKSKTALTE